MSRTLIVAGLLVASMSTFAPYARAQLKKGASGPEWWQQRDRLSFDIPVIVEIKEPVEPEEEEDEEFADEEGPT